MNACDQLRVAPVVHSPVAGMPQQKTQAKRAMYLVDLVVIFSFLAKNGGARACWGAPPPRPPARGASPPWTPR